MVQGFYLRCANPAGLISSQYNLTYDLGDKARRHKKNLKFKRFNILFRLGKYYDNPSTEWLQYYKIY